MPDEQSDSAFLERIILLTTLPCLSDPTKCIVVGQPSRQLTDVLPYVNSLLPNVISYAPEAGVITLRRQPGFITIYPDRVYITQVRDVGEGLQLLDALCELLNKIWAHRKEIAPTRIPRRTPSLLDVWRVLPRTNCKRCGFATCLAFAVNLLLGKVELAVCAPLAEGAVGQRSALAAMLHLDEGVQHD